MKQLIVIGVMAYTATAMLRATPITTCVTLSSLTFQALETAGSCSINDKVYSNFSLLSVATGGATAVTANAVKYTVIDNGNIANGFNFQFILNALANQSNDLLIGFDVSILSGPALITSAHLDLSGATAIGANSAATVGETVCPGHDIAGCPSGVVMSVGVLGSGTSKPTDSVTFPGVLQLGVSKDINVVGGPSGFASISGLTEVVDQSGFVPEPGPMLLIGAGLLGIGLLARKHYRTTASSIWHGCRGPTRLAGSA